MSREDKIIAAALEVVFLALTTWSLTSPGSARQVSMRLLRHTEQLAMFVARRAADLATHADKRCREMMIV